MYIERVLEKQILKASEQYPVVMLCGQRQVGKSTMLFHIKSEQRQYVTLDDRNAKRLAENDPELFFETYGDCLLIDEFQRVPSLLIEIKKIVDRRRLLDEPCNGMFWLTGSQKFLMMKDISETLAGRVSVYDISGLSQDELNRTGYGLFLPDIAQLKKKGATRKSKTVHQIFEEIYAGGMPEIRASGADRDRYYMNYVNTYLERDIKDLAQVGKLNEFYDFLVYMASRTAQALKYEEIANAVGITSPTAKAWVSILERSGIIYILRPYHSNIYKRLVKTPKVYFMDTGLAAYLCRWPDAATLERGAMDGAFFETFVVSEIVKSYYNEGLRPDLYYYRDTDKKEIDLLILKGNKVYPIEIKKGKEPKDADKNFRVLDKLDLEIQTGLVICMSDDLIPYNRNTYYCPVTLI